MLVYVGRCPDERSALVAAARELDRWRGLHQVGSAHPVMAASVAQGAVIVVGSVVSGTDALRLSSWRNQVRPDVTLVFLHDGSPDNARARQWLAAKRGIVLAASDLNGASLDAALSDFESDQTDVARAG